MWSVIGEAAVVFACVTSLTSMAGAQTPAELLDRLHRVEQKTSLNDDTLKPWHLKLTVDLFDDKDAPKEKGTIEEWWFSKKTYRVVYDFPSYAATEVHTEEGSFRTPGKALPPYFLWSTLQRVLHPVMIPTSVSLSNLRPVSSSRNIGLVKLDCISFQPIKSVDVGDKQLLHKSYCLGAGTDQLVASSPFESASVLRVKIGTFQGRALPLEQIIKIGTRRAATAHVDQLQSESTLLPSDISHDGLDKYASFIDLQTDTVEAGKFLAKAAPSYPMTAKMNGITGSVTMAAIIDKMGHVDRLELLASPDSSLTKSAMDAVRKWTYEPYLVDNSPVEVFTTVTVNYSLSSR